MYIEWEDHRSAKCAKNEKPSSTRLPGRSRKRKHESSTSREIKWEKTTRRRNTTDRVALSYWILGYLLNAQKGNNKLSGDEKFISKIKKEASDKTTYLAYWKYEYQKWKKILEVNWMLSIFKAINIERKVSSWKWKTVKEYFLHRQLKNMFF